MPIIYNGTTVEKVIYNGTELDKVEYNGVTVFESKPQLSTPQNVTADGTVVSWDEVENATSYEVYADGTSIGTVKSLIKFSFSYPYNVTATSNYECEEGMTWEEFVNSGYNPVAGGENKRLYIYNGSVSQHNGPSAYGLVFTQGDDSSYVKATDKIVANHAYYESSGQ